MAGYERKIVQLLKKSGFSVIRNPPDLQEMYLK